MMMMMNFKVIKWTSLTLTSATFLLAFLVCQSHEDASADIQVVASDSSVNLEEEKIKFEEFKKSSLFLPSFEDNVISLPAVQADFIRKVARSDLDLYRTILREAIDKKNNFAPGITLMMKYSGKLLTNFIKNRRNEQKLKPRKEPNPAFFTMIANLFDIILTRSGVIKKEKGYTKRNVDTEDLYRRVDAVFNYVLRIIDASPVAAYHKWDQLVFFKGEPNQKELIEEASDLAAQFRGMGYESCVFVARRIVNLLNMFAKGKIPEEREV